MRTLALHLHQRGLPQTLGILLSIQTIYNKWILSVSPMSQHLHKWAFQGFESKLIACTGLQQIYTELCCPKKADRKDLRQLCHRQPLHLLLDSVFAEALTWYLS